MENSERDGNTRPPDLPPEKSVCRSGNKKLELDMEQKTGSNRKRSTSPCLFNLYAECAMKNAGLDEAQAGIKIARRNISNLRYTDDTTLMAESEELKSLLMKVKEESEKAGLKLKTQRSKKQRSWHLVSSLHGK